MAKIAEELILYDRFSNTFTSYIKQAETAANATKAARTATQQMEQAQKAASASTDTLSRSLKSLVGGYLGLQGLRSVLNLSDTITATTARLDMMNDGLQTTAELNSMIWQSAQRARGAYAGTASFVAQLGNLAGNAFSSNAEIVAFAEQINKQIALSGTSAVGASAAILQLTQGLSSGALRGEELNSVLEQTPMIAQTIAGYMGVTTGEMRELASQGAVTAEVVKNAMFAAADETNAKFEQMPYTWSQVWTQAQNIMIQAFQPALDMVGQMSDWIGNNMDTAIAAFYGLAAAVAVYTAATWLASAANRAFIASLMSNPFLWIAVAIGFVVAAIYQWIQAVGGLEAAWLIAKDTVLSAWEELQYGAQSVATGVANWMSQMAINVINAVNAMVNGAIDGINGLIGHVNAIVGTSFGTIDHVTIGASRKLSLYAEISDRNANLYAVRGQFDAVQRAREAEIRAKQAAIAQSAAPQNPVGYTPYDNLTNQMTDIGKSVKSIEKSVSMSEEDIKSLVDAAERRYVANVNLTSQTPVINITGANTGNTAADRQAIADAVQYVLMEQLASGGVRATSRP